AKTQVALDQVRTEQARTQAALARATEQEQKARRSAGESEAGLNFLRERRLSAARPRGQGGGMGTETAIPHAGGAAEPKVAESFRNQPSVEAAIRETLGETYRYLGEWPRAIRQHERALNLRTSALGPDHPDTLVSGSNL